MEELLNQLLSASQLPALTALVLGLLTAISPCPLATNITALAYISNQVENRRHVFLRGLLYTLGRTAAYSILGAVLIFIIRRGEDTFNIQQAVSEWGERLLGPVLVAVGLLMLFGHKLNLPKFGFSGDTGNHRFGGGIGALVLGILFAMAFCPSSGLFYFGMLIPLSVGASGGYLLPVVYAIATSLPVIAAAWVLAFSLESLSRFMDNISRFQKWFNIVVALIFIAVGIFYIITIIL